MAIDKIALKIASYYTEYVSLLESPKKFSEGLNFVFQTVKGESIIKKEVSFVDGSGGGGDMQFVTKQRKRNDYRILLFQKSFIEKPVIRFDSDGPAHYNHGADITNVSVPTPHFHKYNDQGKEIAYLTPELENRDYAADIKYNVKSGMQLFCKEAVIMCDDDFSIKIGMFDADTLNMNKATDPLQDFY